MPQWRVIHANLPVGFKEANVDKRKKRKNGWTQREDRYLLDNYSRMTDKVLMAGLPRRTKAAVTSRRIKLDCVKYRRPRHRPMPVDPPDRSITRFAAVTRPHWEGFIGTSR